MVINNLSYKYNRNVIFDKASFTIEKGLYVLSCPSGSGKSTLLYLLHGLLSSKIKRNYASSLMSQELYLYGRYAHSYLYSLSKNKDLINYYLRIFNIDQSKKIKDLSLGQKQKICFIAAILKNADMYLFDEPFSNVDEKTKNIMIDILENLSKSKIVVIASHISINKGRNIIIHNKKVIINE